MEYKKKSDGNHFYRIGDNILHVFHIKNDAIVTEEGEFINTTTEFKKDDCCINTIHEIHDENLINISKEEFENKLREVIFILGIYEFIK